MKKIYVLSGISGSGKTYERTHNPMFSSVAYVDIADIYRRYRNPVTWEIALSDLMEEVEAILEVDDEVVIEGFFLYGSPSRQWIEWLCERNDWEFVFLEFNTPVAVCYERVLLDAKKYQENPDLTAEQKEWHKEFTAARLALLSNYLRE